MFPVSSSGKNSVSRTFLRARFSYKSIGRSKCMSIIPPACSRSILSSMEVSVRALIRKKKTADYTDVTNGIFWGAHAPTAHIAAPRRNTQLFCSTTCFKESKKFAPREDALASMQGALRDRSSENHWFDAENALSFRPYYPRKPRFS